MIQSSLTLEEILIVFSPMLVAIAIWVYIYLLYGLQLLLDYILDRFVDNHLHRKSVKECDER